MPQSNLISRLTLRSQLEAYQSAIDIVKSHGGKVVTQVEVTPASKITYGGQSGYGILHSMTFRLQHFSESFLSNV